MKKILRLDLIVTTLILCASFLLCGIVEINDRTSYVISGSQSEVFRSQKQDGSPSFSLKIDGSGDSASTLFTFDLSSVEKIASYAKYCSFPPVGCVISFFEETTAEK